MLRIIEAEIVIVKNIILNIEDEIAIFLFKNILSLKLVKLILIIKNV